jgi:hypothetical protein
MKIVSCDNSSVTPKSVRSSRLSAETAVTAGIAVKPELFFMLPLATIDGTSLQDWAMRAGNRHTAGGVAPPPLHLGAMGRGRLRGFLSA